jgi:hypothetical protein
LPNQPTFTRENLNADQRYDPHPNQSPWSPYRKKGVTWMMRVSGPFKVQTQEGLVACDDGYVAIDEEGWPYPVSASVHAKSYEATE